jgi:hypothetical protein
MARYTTSLETPRPPAEAFAYRSDFPTTKEWEPGVVEADRLGALKGPLRIADPLLGLAFDRVGDRALEGLRAMLGARLPGRLPRLSGRSLDGARTITVYTDVGKAVRELGLEGTDTIGVLLVDRSGRILAREHGGLDDRKATRLTAALEGSSEGLSGAPEPSGP